MNTLSQFVASAVHAPLRSNALAEKLNTVQMAQTSIRAAKRDIALSFALDEKRWLSVARSEPPRACLHV
jgi:hypothetical protein